MKKRIIILSVLIVAMSFVFQGCGEKNQVVNYEEADGETVTITFFGFKYEPENVRIIEQIISGFMKENTDIRVSYESLKGAEYFEALQRRMESGKGNDVFMVNHDVMLDLEEKGQVADLSGLDSISAYTDLMRDQMEEDGEIHWIPTTVSAFGLYCNMELLQEHEQKVPENLGEWEEVCRYFVKKGITPIIANNDISLKTLAIGRGFYSAYESGRQAEILNEINNGEEKMGDFLHPGFSIAEEFVDQEFIDRETALNTNKTSDDLEEFVKGETPFMLTGAWAAGRVKSMNPGLDFEVAPLPVLEEGTMLVINPDTRLSVNADSEHLDAAMKFVEYFTKTENIQKFADQQCSFSPLKNGSPSSVNEIQPLISDYTSGRTVIGADALLNIPIWEVTAEASQKILEGEDLDQVIEWIDSQTMGGSVS